MNSVCERFLGSLRREALDHILILGERHMQRVLGEYALQYHNCSRPHQGLAQRIPVSKPRQTCDDASKVVAMPVLGGLHHDYVVAA
jgi:putative transposase